MATKKKKSKTTEQKTNDKPNELTDKKEKKPSGRQKVTDEQIEEALRKTKGLITMAARWIGQTYGIPITHGAISQRVASSEHLRQVRRECEEDGLDFAEYKLLDLIKSGDRTAIIFYLKCKGKERGYIERKEFSGPEGGAIPIEQHTVDLSKLSDEELKLFEEITRKLYGGKTTGEPAGTG